MKILIIGVFLLLLVGGVSAYIYLEQDNIPLSQEQNIIVKDPSTGEVWNSIEEYEFRNLKLNEMING